MFIKCITAIIITAVSSLPAMARDIVVTSINTEGLKKHVVSVDIDSVRELNGKKRAWTYTVVREKGKPPFMAASHIEIDCGEERSRMLQDTFYNADHSVSFTKSEASEWNFPPPVSKNGELLQFICSGAKVTVKQERLGDADPVILFDALLKEPW